VGDLLLVLLGLAVPVGKAGIRRFRTAKQVAGIRLRGE
jgi:hypothetical protein